VEPAEEATLGRRPRRAIAIIAASLTLIVVASLVYLHPKIEVPRNPLAVLPTPTQTPPFLPDRYTADFAFVTPTLGWSLISEIRQFWIFRTTDEARTWEQQLTGPVDFVNPFQFSERRRPIQFFDRMRGLVHVTPNTVFATADGGRTWTRLNLPKYSIESLTFSDSLNGWLLGSVQGQSPRDVTYHLESTADGGDTWTALPSPPLSKTFQGFILSGLQFRNSQEGWARATDPDQNAVYSTNDGGATWQPHLLPVTTQPVQGKPAYPVIGTVTLLPGGGVLASTRDAGFTSFDGGAKWRPIIPVPGTGNYRDFAFQDATHWWAMQFDSNLYKSSDAGQTWKRVSFQLDALVYTIGVTDAQHAWARLESQVPPRRGFGLALSSDGGVHWTYAKVPTPT
jgi:photosystem II stability/assembly factor-like uncharacterized protein